MTDAELEAYMDASAAVLGIAIAPEWRDAVRANLALSLRMATVVAAFPLEDEAEPAPVFTP
ncbi:MAG: DUF4089 domain-containing protein [Alphaproteobacteria bacterium]|nr:DUF4089 domain-containing protein [Alphaproteobacteria bacterium]